MVTPYVEIDETVEMLAFNLKLLAKKSRKNVLISAGKPSDKEKMLPAIKKLKKLSINIYSTKGTSRFLNDHGVPNQEIYKITEKKEPNIKSFLDQDRFDLVINVLTGYHDYDEASDSQLIRTLSIENGIPLITDVNVAIMTIEQMVVKQKKGVYKYKIADKTEPWNLKLEFFQLVDKLGGFACYHAHLDKSYLITMENLKLSQMDMQKKWEIYRYLKESYTHEDLVERMVRGVEIMIKQGVTSLRTHVDADSTVKLLPIRAAKEVREMYSGRITIEIGVQPLQGILDKESKKYYEKAAEEADVLGGLPSRDRPRPEKHLDYILNLARDMGKPVDVHIDQENNPYESESELLALKTMEHGMEGKVFGVHAISLSAKPPIEQDRIIRLIKEAGISVIICPSAAISMKPHEISAPLHNSIAPFLRLLNAKVPVFLGADNIHDIFMPVSDGDMWFECRLLMEACRMYDIEKVAEIACDSSGFGPK